VEGAAVAGPLPPTLQNATTYATGVFNTSKARDAALALIGLLASPAFHARWEACGFEIPAQANAK